jgi:signal transduction histidine kinase
MKSGVMDQGPCLVLLSETFGDKIYPLSGVVTIGRRSDRVIQIPDHRVASEHAEVFERDGEWWIRDLAESGATLVNSQPVREHQLRPNDRIEIGGCQNKLFFAERRLGARTAAAAPGTAAPEAAKGGNATGSAPMLSPAAIEREIERRVASRIAETERLARERGALLSMAAHDLKTPLSGILGYIEALEHRVAATPEARWVATELAVVASAAHGMMELLTDLLDRQKADSGRMDLVLVETDVEQFLKGLTEIYHRWASAAERRVDLRLATPIPPARLDQKRLTQILNNLVHNALKHTPRGKRTTIESRCTGTHLEFSVANEGKGFDPTETDRMLACFVRGTAGEPPIGEGHGLGLAIVDKLVGVHGGKLVVEGKPGRGARFSFSLPLRGPAAPR